VRGGSRARRREVAVSATAGECVRGWPASADNRKRAAVSTAAASVPSLARAIARSAGVNRRPGSASCHASEWESRAVTASRRLPGSHGPGLPGRLDCRPRACPGPAGCSRRLRLSCCAGRQGGRLRPRGQWGDAKVPVEPGDVQYPVGCGETAVRRRKPPSSLARRLVLTSTASPLASRKLTWDRSMTSRLKPAWSNPRSRSRKAGALAISSSPASSAMVMPP
jgi:hypothetical protein